MLENNWVTSQYPRMGNISSKFPGGSLILPLLNNFVFLRPINSINYCKWFTLAKKSTEISGGNQSLLNLNLSYSVNSIFFPCTFIHMPVLLYILTSSTSPISINITGFSFQLHYLIQESGFDLTKLTSFKVLTFYKLSVHFFFIKPWIIERKSFYYPWSNFSGYWSSTARCDLNKQLMARKVKTFELRKCDWVNFLTSFSRQDKVRQK